MSAQPRPFEQPIYVTRPMLPELAVFTRHLEAIWSSAVLSNGGPQHVELERRLQAHLGDGHIALFNNGTNALMTAVKALDLSGEVITTPFTFAATPHVLSWHGIDPVFVDIEERSMTLDPERIEAAITPRTTGILAVHVYGNPCDVWAIERIARKHGLKVSTTAPTPSGPGSRGARSPPTATPPCSASTPRSCSTRPRAARS